MAEVTGSFSLVVTAAFMLTLTGGMPWNTNPMSFTYHGYRAFRL